MLYSLKVAVCQKMLENLKNTFNYVVSVVNCIKVRPFNSKLFKFLCEEIPLSTQSATFAYYRK